jgi:Leucine-rich repeat (LRR) protein
LHQLEWLDLSFNNIKMIQGLEKLVNLTDLSLYSNQIKELSGLDNLCKLNVFSFGKNFVKSFDYAIIYMKGLKNNLQVLKMADNPFEKAGGQKSGDEYRLYAIEMLKGLKYLDYELITDEDKKEAKNKHHDEAGDKDQGNANDNDEASNIIDEDLISAKLEKTHNLFKRIRDESEEAKKLINLSKFQELFSNHLE